MTTDQEKSAALLLAKAWEEYLNLPDRANTDDAEFQRAIHGAGCDSWQGSKASRPGVLEIVICYSSNTGKDIRN